MSRSLKQSGTLQVAPEVSTFDARFLGQAAADARYATGALGPLYGYYAKLSQASTVARCNVLMMGDSIMEGFGATSIATRWTNQAQDKMRKAFTASATGGEYVPAEYISTNNLGVVFPAFTFTGTNFASSYGVGFKARQLDLNATATITRTCTSIDLWFRLAVGGQSVSIAVDGGAPVTVAIDAIAKKWNSGPLTPGSHTVVVTSTTGSTVICGGYFYNGDETAGLALIDGSHSGARMLNYANTFFDDFLVPMGIDLVVLGCLTNDIRTSSGGYSSATFKTHTETIITKIRAKNASLPILMMPPYMPITTLIEPWANYIAKLRELAVQYPYIAVYDMSVAIPNLATDPYGFLNDSVHATSKGQALMATIAANSALSPR